MRTTQHSSTFSRTGTRIRHKVKIDKGTLAWAGRAAQRQKDHPETINATIGTAKSDEGKLLVSKTVKSEICGLSSDEMFGYGKIKGLPAFIAGWKTDTINMYPEELRDSAKQKTSDPLPVAGGLTTGLYVVSQATLDPGDVLVTPDARWGNIDNVFAGNQGLEIQDFSFFDQKNCFNLTGLKQAIQTGRESGKKVALYLNMPNNPTGYMINHKELKNLSKFLEAQTEELIIILDDAYEGYVYQKDMSGTSNPIKSSLFPYIFDRSENVIVFKIDGPSKRRSMYGFRLGVVSFGPALASMKSVNLRHLLAKTARTIFSSAPRPPQEALAKIYSNSTKYEAMQAEMRKIIAILERRHNAMLEKEGSMPEIDALKPMPANSGFFHLYNLSGMNAQLFGEKLLENGLGVVPIANESGLNGIRLAHCGIPTNKIDSALEILWKTALEHIDP
ncbi:MAG: aminotransferase class I/II-fold pyridoxal phosphate-dependent enzyme [Candidatus Heimdallarchaeota archaeon]